MVAGWTFRRLAACSRCKAPSGDQCKDSEEQGHFQSHAATQESNGPDIACKDRAGEAKAIPGRQPKKDGYQYELARKDGPIDRILWQAEK